MLFRKVTVDGNCFWFEEVDGHGCIFTIPVEPLPGKPSCRADVVKDVVEHNKADVYTVKSGFKFIIYKNSTGPVEDSDGVYMKIQDPVDAYPETIMPLSEEAKFKLNTILKGFVAKQKEEDAANGVKDAPVTTVVKEAPVTTLVNEHGDSDPAITCV